MNCGQKWTKSKSKAWTTQVTAVSNVVTLVGQLRTINWGAKTTTTKTQTIDQQQLANGVTVTLQSGRTYTLDVYVMAATNQTARVHTKIDFEGTVAVDDDCDRTAAAPISEWEVRRL
jgi:hypothetical protein